MAYSKEKAIGRLITEVIGFGLSEKKRSEHTKACKVASTFKYGWVFYFDYGPSEAAGGPSYYVFCADSGLIYETSGLSLESNMHDLEKRLDAEAEGKEWVMSISSGNKLEVYKNLKRILSITNSEIKALIPRIPGPIFKGNARMLNWFSEKLCGEGLVCEVQLLEVDQASSVRELWLPYGSNQDWDWEFKYELSESLAKWYKNVVENSLENQSHYLRLDKPI